MELIRVDTQRAYELIWEKITTLDLVPGSAINELDLAEELDLGFTSVREALMLLFHDDLVVITSRHGFYVADINLPDLAQLSEMRLALESLCARQAAERATPDDIVVLEALRQEQAAISPEDSSRLFEVDHKFHQAVARAAAPVLARLFPTRRAESMRWGFLRCRRMRAARGSPSLARRVSSMRSTVMRAVSLPEKKAERARSRTKMSFAMWHSSR